MPTLQQLEMIGHAAKIHGRIEPVRDDFERAFVKYDDKLTFWYNDKSGSTHMIKKNVDENIINRKGLKVKTLKIENIGIIEKEEIKIDKPLSIFYGEIQQGKSTILNCIKMLFGGTFPKDIIRHGESSGKISLVTETGSITRSFYKNKKDEIVARPIQFIKDGEPVDKPVDELKKMVNPFLLDGDFLNKMSGTERQKYFVDLFGVDTEELDNESKAIESEAKELRIEIKSFGDINIEKVEKPDIDKLKAEKVKIDNANDEKIKIEHKGLIKFNDEQTKAATEIVKAESAVETLESDHTYNEGLLTSVGNQISGLQGKLKIQLQQKVVLEDRIKKGKKYVAELPKPKEKKDLSSISVELDSTTEIEEKISNAKADEIRYNQYVQDVARKEKKDKKVYSVKEKEVRLATIKKEKISLLSGISDKICIEHLKFDENGNFNYKNTHADMLSTSQIMELSSELSKLYPKGLGVELIDRGESLGKSIYTYINKAIEEDKTILAAIVGEKPATVRENIGVFVVENGKIK